MAHVWATVYNVPYRAGSTPAASIVPYGTNIYPRLSGQMARELFRGEKMNQTILKIIGIIAVCLGSVALFLTGIGESAVIAIVAAVFVLAGLILALFSKKMVKGVKSPPLKTTEGFIELCAIVPKEGLVAVGIITKSCYEGIRKVLGAD